MNDFFDADGFEGEEINILDFFLNKMTQGIGIIYPSKINKFDDRRILNQDRLLRIIKKRWSRNWKTSQYNEIRKKIIFFSRKKNERKSVSVSSKIYNEEKSTDADKIL